MIDAAKSELEFATVQPSVLYLPSMEIEGVIPKESLILDRKKKVVTAFEGIREGRFQAEPNQDNCKKCQYFFPCPS